MASTDSITQQVVVVEEPEPRVFTLSEEAAVVETVTERDVLDAQSDEVLVITVAGDDHVVESEALMTQLVTTGGDEVLLAEEPGLPMSVREVYVQELMPVGVPLPFEWWETDGAGVLQTLWVVDENGVHEAGGGSALEMTVTAGMTVSGHRVVTADSLGRAVYASNDSLTGRFGPLWLTLGAAVEADPVRVATAGLVEDGPWSWVPEQPIFVDGDGGLTQAPPVAPPALWSVQFAVAVSTASIFIAPSTPITLTT